MSLLFSFSIFLIKSSVPDFAIVPKDSINSSLVMPIPLSEISSTLFFLLAVTKILNSSPFFIKEGSFN